jgi:hypothetical protein
MVVTVLTTCFNIIFFLHRPHTKERIRGDTKSCPTMEPSRKQESRKT